MSLIVPKKKLWLSDSQFCRHIIFLKIWEWNMVMNMMKKTLYLVSHCNFYLCILTLITYWLPICYLGNISTKNVLMTFRYGTFDLSPLTHFDFLNRFIWCLNFSKYPSWLIALKCLLVGLTSHCGVMCLVLRPLGSNDTGNKNCFNFYPSLLVRTFGGL